MIDNLLYCLAFSHFYGIGPVRFLLLKKHFGTVEKAYKANRNDLVRVLGLLITDRFIKFRNNFDPEKKLEDLKRNNIRIVCLEDESYPESLKNIPDPPICLYVKSSIPNFFLLNGRARPASRDCAPPKTQKNLVSSLLFSIVGTRNPTAYGIQVAGKFSYELSKAGFVIVSGLAYGIDTVAHKACLEAGGITIAVLGCGVDIVYPLSNKTLYENIIKKGGAIVSEFPPGQYVLKGLFIARNRIISGLSRGVMIVEGLEDSGSLITAKYAAEQGKDVFAPPSPITSKMSVAPNLLLKQGAKLVTKVEDIYDEFNLKIPPIKKADIVKSLKKEDKEIFLLLSENPFFADDLAVVLKKPIGQVLNILSMMEIGGLIEKDERNKYQIRLH